MIHLFRACCYSPPTTSVLPLNSTLFVTLDPATLTSNFLDAGANVLEPGASDSVSRLADSCHCIAIRIHAPFR